MVLKLVDSTTELTTSATDALLAVECVFIATFLWRTPANGRRWRIFLWCWVFGLLAFSSLLGAIAHGIEVSPALGNALWKPLYWSLGIVVALFIVGAVHDCHGEGAARRLVPWAIVVGTAFFAVAELVGGAFIAFVIYEAASLVGALILYLSAASSGKLRGAGLIAGAIVLNLAAAGVQASNISARILVPLDHNGMFHVVEIIGALTLGLGVRMGLSSDAPRLAIER